MGVLTLPIIPDSYHPLIISPAAGITHWKSIEAGRARWVATIRRPILRQLAAEWALATAPLRRAGSPGHAMVLVEQALPAAVRGWEGVLYDAYAQVGQDFAARTARGLKAQWVEETKADPIVAALGAGGLEDRWMTVVADWLSTNGGARIRQIQGTTLGQIRDIITKGVRDGAGIPVIARELEKLGPPITAWRAVTIARTEVIAASNLGARAGAIDTGLPLDHEWIATPGPRTRKAHAAANGQVQPMDTPFLVAGEKLLFPGDGSQGATAKNLVLCRCTVGYVPVGEQGAATGGEPWPIAEDARRVLHEPAQNGDWAAWRRQLSDDELEAIRRYSRGSYVELNKGLRADPSGQLLPEEQRRLKSLLDSALLKAGDSQAESVVWRGVSRPRGIADAEWVRERERFSVGTEVTWNGFVSTSHSPGYAADTFTDSADGLLFEIRSRRGAYIQPLPRSRSGEYERILPHGSRFRVRGVVEVEIDDLDGGTIRRQVVQLDDIGGVKRLRAELERKSVAREVEADESTSKFDARNGDTEDTSDLLTFRPPQMR